MTFLSSSLFLFIFPAGAMMTIQSKYSIKRNWEGDPCSPEAFAWTGLNCSYNTSGAPRIIALSVLNEQDLSISFT
jgi:hypothetical protein